MKNIFEWKCTSHAKAAYLGLTISLLWAFQHPLQGPLYKIIGKDVDGVLECILYAELLCIPFDLLLLGFRNVRVGAKNLFAQKGVFKDILIASAITFIGIFFYAVGQQHVDGTQISILLNASPLYVFCYTYFDERKQHPEGALKKALSSGDLYIHLILVIVVACLTIAGAGVGWITTNFFYTLLIFLVPAAYYGSGHYLRRNLGKDPDTHLAALSLVGLFNVTVISSFIFIYLHLRHHVFSLSQVDTNIALIFAVGGIMASSFAAFGYHLLLRQPGETIRFATITFHSVPFFSLVIAFAAAPFVNFPLEPNKYFAFSAVIVAAALILKARLSYNNRQTEPEKNNQ